MRIMVVSPVRLFRDCLAAALGSMEPVPEVMAEVSVAALYHRPPGEQPDVVLVDVTQDIGMEEVALVAEKRLNLPLLALGLPERREEVIRQSRAGFVGYVARDATIQDLQSAISDAVAGRMRYPAEISAGVIRALFNREHPAAPGHAAPSLTKREPEVRQMIGLGLSNKEITPSIIGRDKSVALDAKGVGWMNSSHVATGTITALLAIALVYLSKWPLQPLDVPTASAFAGLLVAFGGALVKFYQSRTMPPARPVVPVLPIAPPNLVREPPIAA